MQAKASRKHIRNSPRKMRIVADRVRGLRVTDALNQLHYMPQAAARPIEITIQSAVHNYLDKPDAERSSEENLVVQTIMVDAAPMFKRIRPAPRGRAHRIRKRNSHLTVVVGLVEPSDDADQS